MTKMPSLECDLVMKGGITSGVVYPHAITELANTYRLRNIGGTSAGAIAAVFAAAAEYRRQGGGQMNGFDEVGEVANELGRDLLGLFQPTKELKPIFELLKCRISKEFREKGWKRILPKWVIENYWVETLLGAGVMVTGLIGAVVKGNLALGVLAVVAGLLCSVVLIGCALWRALVRDIPANDFGLCRGKTVGTSQVLGFTDWIADKIDVIADNLNEKGQPGDPLTVGQVVSRGVLIATMTTDLSSARPYQLPLQTSVHFFSKAEFERLFPARVVQYLCDKGEYRGPRAEDADDLPKDLYKLPVGDDFPVLLVARMSLSFPGLISAIPLYRVDYQLKRASDNHAPLRRCLFSDGGISSNFPIHFFDDFLPRRPTFGITLGAWEEVRHGDTYVHLPEKSSVSTDFAVSEICSIPSFLFAILNTAKDWQDSMQSLLPGYADRIVSVRLDESSEGGMNLTMDSETIKKLSDHGREAGKKLVDDFDMDQHRWNRAMSLLPELEGAVARYSIAYRNRPTGSSPDESTYEEVLRDFGPKQFKNSRIWRDESLMPFAEGLARLGEIARQREEEPDQRSIRQGRVPWADSRIRLIAIANRVPK